MPGPSAAPIVLSEEERAELVRRASGPGRWRAGRARIILACAEGMSNAAAARALGGAVKAAAVDPAGPGRGRDRGDLGVHAWQGHALVAGLDGRPDRLVEVDHRADLEEIRPQTAPAGLLQTVHRPAVRGESRRRRGLVSQPARTRGGAVRR